MYERSFLRPITAFPLLISSALGIIIPRTGWSCLITTIDARPRESIRIRHDTAAQHTLNENTTTCAHTYVRVHNVYVTNRKPQLAVSRTYSRGDRHHMPRMRVKLFVKFIISKYFDKTRFIHCVFVDKTILFLTCILYKEFRGYIAITEFSDIVNIIGLCFLFVRSSSLRTVDD